MLVYKVTNLVNNKKYFCVTGYSSLKQPKWTHRHRAKAILRRMKLKPESRMGRSPFHKALARYGEINFKYKVLGTFSNTTDAYAYKERLITEYNTMNPKYGYNCTTGGNRSFKHASHVKERCSVAQTGKTMPDSFVKIMKERVGESHPSFGIKHSKEIRERMRQGQLNSDYVPSKETNKKTSETMKKRWQEPEVIARMAKRKLMDISGKNNPMYGKGRKGKDNPMYGKPAWNRGVPMTEEQKKKLQEGREKYQTKKRKELLKKCRNMTEKKCRICKEVKLLDMFYRDKSKLDGYCYLCKQCESNKKNIKDKE
mgnify:CR=1 FL=1